MIVVAKFTDGTEIIGELTSEAENMITLAHPLQIIYKYSMTSPLPTVSFARYMMFADITEFDFQKVDFVVVSPAVPDIIPVYRRMVKMLSKKEPTEELKDVSATDIDDMKKDLYSSLLESLDGEQMTKH